MTLLANPKSNLIYTAEVTRLSARILAQLSALEKVQTKKALSTFEVNLHAMLAAALPRIASYAYTQGATQVSCPIDITIAHRINREALARAKEAASWITATTGTALDITAGMSKKQALSGGRADAIAVNELSLQFFGGTRYGWGLDPTARKTWNLSSAHDNDDTCDDNADEGPISINDAFQSGHFIPPAHINCECLLGLVRVKAASRYNI